MEWFKSWFDTPYYHLLYHNRNDEEAQGFIDRLLEYLNVSKEARVLDVACGKGRHAIYMNEKGFNVTGIDLSEHSIMEAKESENDRLRFFVRDMRKPLKHEYDVILNMFTSFGYFENRNENRISINHLAKALHPDGCLVVDFLNSKKAQLQLVHREKKTVDGIDFFIERKFTGESFIKRIRFMADGEEQEFQEQVQALTLADFKECFEDAGLQIVDTFGDYDLGPFHALNSDRLILIAIKTAV